MIGLWHVSERSILSQPPGGVFASLYGRLAQLVRACDSHSQGHWFEPSIVHHWIDSWLPARSERRIVRAGSVRFTFERSPVRIRDRPPLYLRIILMNPLGVHGHNWHDDE